MTKQQILEAWERGEKVACYQVLKMLPANGAMGKEMKKKGLPVWEEGEVRKDLIEWNPSGVDWSTQAVLDPKTLKPIWKGKNYKGE